MANNKLNNIKLAQLDKVLSKASKYVPSPPKRGWISEIRNSLLLTTKQFAKRLGIDQSAVSHLETSERNNSITLNSLHRAAEALNCEVKYIFVPKIPLEEQLWKQAKKVLSKEISEVKHTMKLEQQGTKNLELENDIDTAFLLYERGGKIWDE